MKNKLMIAALFAAVAIASHGGNALVAHAQTATTIVTTSNTAALQQQLDDAKAQLIQLQMQAGQIPAGDSGAAAAQQTSAPATSLSATDIADMNTALTALSSMLTNLQAKVTQDPQFAASNGSAVASVLQGIGHTVALIGTEMTGTHLAMVTPTTAQSSGSTGSAGKTGSVAATQPAVTPQPTQTAQASPAQTAPTTASPAPANTAPATAANIAPQTAQAASTFSFASLNWPLIIVIILIVAAIAIWLWWDDGDEKNQPAHVMKSNPSASQKPLQQPLQPINQVSVSLNNQGNTANKQPANTQTPLSSAVAQHGNR